MAKKDNHARRTRISAGLAVEFPSLLMGRAETEDARRGAATKATVEKRMS